MGIQAVQLASVMGMRPIVVDTGNERRKLALNLGAEHFIDFNGTSNPGGEVIKLTGAGAHAVFVTGLWTSNQLGLNRV